MQINLANILTFPPVGPQVAPGKPAPSAAPPAPPVEIRPAAPPIAGVIYTGSGNAAAKSADASASAPAAGTDLNEMSLENQLEFGKNRGVFTKITLSKDGVLVAKADPAVGAKSPEFVASAVATMKDFEDGIALLKGNAPAASAKPVDFLSGSLKNLQHMASRLNVFA